MTIGKLARSQLSFLQKILLAALLAQVSILLGYFFSFFTEMFLTSSTIQSALTPALVAELAIIAAVALCAWLWSGPDLERWATAALTLIATLLLFHFIIGLLSGRLFEIATPIFLAVALAFSLISAFRRAHSGKLHAESQPPLTAWDALSAVILLTLLIPTVFPYIHYDTKVIWACRAFALGQTPSFAAMAACAQPYSHSAGPSYPPAWSILLWLGIKDPIFQGRLLAWALLPLFAIFFRARLSRIDARLAPPTLLFMLATVNVWDGAATYYADVPLMIFLTAGSLLVLGLPKRGSGSPTSVFDLISGTLCLCVAVLIRPDGLYYLAVVVVAVLWFRWLGKSLFPLWPFLVAAATAAAWLMLRPAILNVAPQYLHPNALWHEAGATSAQALWKLLLVFLNGWQGQWLSHRGVGVLFYLLAGLFLWQRTGCAYRIQCRPGGSTSFPDGRRAPVHARNNTDFFGLVSLGFLIAVPLCFALLPFVGDPTVSCAPGTAYLKTYLMFIRTGLNRMTTHLYPFFILWGVSILGL